MAGAEPGPKDGGGGGGARAPPSRSGAARVAALGPEQLQRVLARVTEARPPFVVQDAARRLRDAARQAALQRGPGAEPPRAPRLLPPQQLEAICVKVTSGDKKGPERPMPPLAAIQPKAARESQPSRRSSGLVGLCVAGPQLLRAQPPGRPGAQLCFLRDLPQTPAPQACGQRPLPALQPVPAKTVRAPQAPDGQGTLAPDLPAAAPSVSSGPAYLFISTLHAKHPEKLKKSFRVKTRSGRISRPPKYKAKDYKFIKTEDLADGRTSDSDDYSELSAEEEEEQQREKQALFDLESCTLRPKAFKCQTCEKSYIGKGGLARHFKLNPGHGQLELEASLPEKVRGSLTHGCQEAGIGGQTSPKLSTPASAHEPEEEAESPRGGLQNGHCIEVEEAVAPDPENETHSVLLGSEGHTGPRSGDLETLAESGAATLEQSRVAQPHQGPAVAAEPRALGSRAWLKESLQQCDWQDLVELALPRLAQVVTLREFLLVKVQKCHLAKPFFPAVYKEFEELHSVVNSMCQDYLSDSGPCSQEPLEINNNKVAESLGIMEFLRRKEIYPDHSASQHPGQERAGEALEAAGRQKRANEAAEKRLDAVKKPRREALPTDAPEALAATSASCGLEKPGPAHAPAASQASAPPGGGDSPCASEGLCGLTASDWDRRTPPADQQLAVFSDFKAGCAPVGPAPLGQAVRGPALHVQLGEPGGQALAQVVAFPEENALEHTADQDTGDSRRSPGIRSTATAGGTVASLLLGGSGHTVAGDLSEMNGSQLNGQQASPGHAFLTEAVMPPLENLLPVDVTRVDCASRPQPGPDGLLWTNEGLRNQAGDLNQSHCRMEARVGQRELDHVVAVGEALAFEVSTRGQEALSHGQDPIFIQTSDGLILSQPGTIVSQGEDFVIVASAVGPALRIGPAEEVPLEAGEAVLTVQAEPSQ